MIINNLKALFTLILLIACGIIQAQNAGDQLLDNTFLHKITIITEDFIDKEDFLEDLGLDYIQVDLIIDGIALDSVGIRLKGGISSIDKERPPIKVDVNRYVSGQKFDGLKKFNLHNNFMDEFMQRDRIAYDLYRRAGVVSPRVTYAEVFFNNEFIGIYTMGDQIDQTFLNENFASDQGTLIKGTFSSVEVKYGDLIDYTNYIDNATATNFGDYVNLETYLKFLAVDVLIEDWDSYSFDRHNYYVYFEPKSERMNFITWDHNFGFDVNGFITEALYPEADSEIVNDPLIKPLYESTMCDLLQYVITDEYIDSTLIHNEDLLNSNSGLITIPSSEPLNQYLKNRKQWLLNELSNLGVTCDLSYDLDANDIVINEFMAQGDLDSGVEEPDGGSPDWIELYNNSGNDILLDNNFYLSDDKEFPKKWNFPNEVVLPANDYLILWADRDIHQEGIHTNFKIDKEGGELLMTYEDLSPIQNVTYDEQMLNESFSRVPNGIGDFEIQSHTFGINNDTDVATNDVSLSQLNLFPNPTIDNIWIEHQRKIEEIEIFNVLGQSIVKLVSPEFPIDVSTLEVGQYFVKIKLDNKNTVMDSFVKIQR